MPPPAAPDVAELYDLLYYPSGARSDPQVVPFLRDILSARAPGPDVLDVACGTGFPTLGLGDSFRLTLADGDAEMLRRARWNARVADARVQQFVLARWDELSPASLGQFDALLCVGNALAQCINVAAVEVTLGAWARLLRPGGLLCVDVRVFPRPGSGADERLEVYGPLSWRQRSYLVVTRERRRSGHLVRTKVLHQIRRAGVGPAAASYRTTYLLSARSALLCALPRRGFRDARTTTRPGRWAFEVVTAIRRSQGRRP